MRNPKSRNVQKPAVLTPDAVDPIVRLWLLRLLVPLEGRRQLIGPYSFDNEEIAQLFDLPGCSASSSDFDAQLARQKLYRCYQAAEKHAHKQVLPTLLANNIQKLTDLVGLSEVEAQLLGFTVLLSNNSWLDQVTGWLGRELNSIKVYHILSVLLAIPESAIRKALSPSSVLSQTGLLSLDRDYNQQLDQKLNLLSASFADRLMTESGSPMDWLRDMVVKSPAPHLMLDDYSHIQGRLALLLPYLQHALSHRRKGVNVFLYGAPGTGKTQLTRLLAQHLACPLYEVSSEDENREPINGKDRLCAFRAAQAFFQKSATFMVFDELEDVFNDNEGFFGKKSTAQTRKAWMNRLLEGNQIPTFWLGNSIDSIDPAFIRRFDWVIELPVPPKAQRERIIRDSCSSLLTDTAIKRLANCEELAPAVVTRAAQVMSTLSGQFPAEQLSTELHQLIDTTLMAQGHPGLTTDHAVRLPDFYDPALLNCDADLKQIAEGIQRHGSARLCLFGPPGTGKSAYSRWLADYLDKPLHIKRGADILSQWVGGTEKNMARAFRQAEQDKAVLMIDEIDSFLQERKTSQHSWEVTAVNEMLTRMEAYNGVFIASTNRMEGLDEAALRRFDLKVKFDALLPEQAWLLLQSHCQALGLAEPNAELKTVLQQLDGLTPGDFAVLERQHRFRPMTDATAMVAALQAECALKTPYQRQAIGFT
jgi:transitional endoplasmic reticulum ATPase